MKNKIYLTSKTTLIYITLLLSILSTNLHSDNSSTSENNINTKGNVSYLGHNIYKFKITLNQPAKKVGLGINIEGQGKTVTDITGSLNINSNSVEYSYYQNKYSPNLKINYYFIVDFDNEIQQQSNLRSFSTGANGINYTFSQEFPKPMNFVELHIIRNNEGFNTHQITDSAVLTENGTTYEITLDKFYEGDEANYRFYGRTANGEEFFFPGPSATKTHHLTFSDTGETFPIFLGQSEISGIKDVFLPVKHDHFQFDKIVPEDATLTILPGEDYRIEENGVVPTVEGEIEINVALRRNTSGNTLEESTFSAIATVTELDKDKTLFLNEFAVIQASDISVRNIFNLLAEQSNVPGLTGTTIFMQLWDTQNAQTDLVIPGNRACDTEILPDGRTGLNGYPYECPRPAGAIATESEEAAEIEMDLYELTGIFNRLDLHDEDYQYCGEQRLVFSRNNLFNDERPFRGVHALIFEAGIPNPTPGSASGCLPIATFWTYLSQTQETSEKVRMLNDFLFKGIQGIPPIVSIEHFLKDSGQIRTNQNVSGGVVGGRGWTFREYKLEHHCSDSECQQLFSMPSPTQDSFFAPLFNGHLPSSTSQYAERAGLFQEEFIKNIDSLLTNNMADLAVKGSLKFTQGDVHTLSSSATDFNEAGEAVYRRHFDKGVEMGISDFETALDRAIEGKTDASGNPITRAQIINRAMTQSCAGCHAPRFFGLTLEGALGDMIMPDGSIQSGWPHSSDLSQSHALGISSALQTLFLPDRFNKLKILLSDAMRQ